MIDEPATIKTDVVVPEVVDMDAYQFYSSPPCNDALKGDINCDGSVDVFDFTLIAFAVAENDLVGPDTLTLSQQDRKCNGSLSLKYLA